MNGKELYDIHRDACQEASDCTTESWDELDESFRADWELTAVKIDKQIGRQTGFLPTRDKLVVTSCDHAAASFGRAPRQHGFREVRWDGETLTVEL